MKIGILTHFQSFQDGYALHVGWLERAKLLGYFERDFDFLVQENCHEGLYPNQKNVLKKPNQAAPFSSQVKEIAKNYLEVLGPYDVILTADLIYQKTFLVQNQAIRDVAGKLRAQWFHWIHSAWTRKPKQISHPQSLRYTAPPGKIVYMNYCDAGYVAEMYGCPPEDVLCVYNPKDFRSFNDFHPLAWEVTKLLKPWEKIAFQVFPHCATRMDAKGIDVVIKTFGALKRAGVPVGVVFANANSGKREAEIVAKKSMLRSYGLDEFKDYVFTSHWTKNAGFPRKAVADLFSVSNLFVFGSWSEVNPNILLEAKISGCLCVLGNRLQVLSEFGGPDQIYFDASFKTPGIPSGQEGDLQLVEYNDEKKYFDDLVKKIMPRIPDKSYQWEFSYEKIWHDQFKPLLDGADIDEAPRSLVVGCMNISGDYQAAPEAVKEMSALVDIMILRYPADVQENDILKLSAFEASLNCQVKLVKGNVWHPIEEMLRALDSIKPGFFIIGLEDEKLPDDFQEKFRAIKNDSGMRAIGFKGSGARIFRWEEGMSFHGDGSQVWDAITKVGPIEISEKTDIEDTGIVCEES